MALVAAAVCPHPPLLVPRLAAGAAVELDELRTACDAAVACLHASSPDVIVVVGGCRDGEPLARDFSAYGLRVGVDSDIDLPLSLLVGAWLLQRSAAGPPVRWLAVPEHESPQHCARLGAELAAAADRVAVLAMADGSARRGPKGPRPADPVAGRFDAEVATALAGADAAALLALAPVEADELVAAGRAAWQVLAGAAGERRFTGRVTYDGAPYGVGYLVATWL